MSDTSEHDDLLFSMLKECKTLPVFLNHIFGFLNRRTDFYHTAAENCPVGLPPGLAEETVKQTFCKWKSVAEPLPRAEPIKPSPVREPELNNFTTSDSYNGAIYDTYSWSQSLTEVDIILRLPQNTTCKDLQVSICPQNISVTLKNGTELLDGQLCEKCKHSDAIWSLQQDKLNIHLDKRKEVWWNRLFTSEPKLDMNKLDCSRPFQELPEEAQAKIEELQWNQERKRLGLPTSDELGMNSVLKESWDRDGSPFSGPFDPSSVKFC